MNEAAPPSSASFPRQRQFTLRQMMLVVLAICIGLAIVVPVYRVTRQHEIEVRCQSNLKQIGLGLHTYHDTWNCFPPASTTDKNGKPLHSWRVLFWPMMESQRYFHEYNMSESWNGPTNSKFHGVVPPYWRCPEDSTSPAGSTNYVAITGPGTAWPGPNRCSRRGDFKDGLSSSIMVVEIRDSDIHWMEPRDLDIRTLKFAVNSDGKNSISSRHIGGAIVLYGDGAVFFLNAQETEARLRNMLLIADEKSDDASVKVEK